MKNPWLNYHHLLYFKTIAEEGTVSRAAEKLRLGQPTLSAQLKQFEDSLGFQLFERHHKKLLLTEQGKIALDYSKGIFKMGSEMIEVLNDRLKPNLPNIHIAALDSIPKQVILKLVEAAYKNSKCQISLSEGRSDELIRNLVAHQVDLLITNFLPTGIDAKGLVPKMISKKNVSFYGSLKFKHLRRGFPKSLSGVPMILPTYDSKLRYDLDHWAKTQEIELNVIAESQDIAMKKLMAVSEIGITPTAAHSISRQIISGELIEIGQIQGVHEELFLISAQRKILNPIANFLMKTFSI